MATLISVHNSEGCVGRCDARCHDAHSPASACDCICGGANHGVGQEKAVENTRAMAESWLERYAREHGLEEWSGELGAVVKQADLMAVLAGLPEGGPDV